VELVKYAWERPSETVRGRKSDAQRRLNELIGQLGEGHIRPTRTAYGGREP